MRLIKHKRLKLIFACLLVILAFATGPSSTITPVVSADQQANCGKGTQPLRINGADNDTCICKNQAQVLVAGDPDTCQAKCPKGTTKSKENGQTVCNQPVQTTTATPQCTDDKGNSYCSHQCGGGSDAVKTSIDIGCKGEGNPITDMIFAFIRFLSAGVGLVVVGSMVVAGIQYTSSRGDPQASAAAKNRIQSNIVALLIYIFAYAILNYVIPVGFFNR